MKLSELNPYSFKNMDRRIKAQIAQEASRRLILYTDGHLVQRHLSVGSCFCRAVVAMGYLTQQQMNHAALRYRLGMSRDGGVIFWQIGHLDQVYDGKVMYYHPDCHRDHGHLPTWVSYELNRFYLSDDPKLMAELQTTHCLFGMHLLDDNRYRDMPVAVVEAEKTAVILSEIYTDTLWMATGGMNELTPTKLFPLRGRPITLYPDTDPDGQAYTTWYQLCRQAERFLGQRIHISPLLELSASPDQKRRKIDLLDYCLEADTTPVLSIPKSYT